MSTQQQAPRKKGSFITFLIGGITTWYLASPFGNRILYPVLLRRFMNYDEVTNTIIGGIVLFFIICWIGESAFNRPAAKQDGEVKGTITPWGRYLVGCCFRAPLYFLPILGMFIVLMGEGNPIRTVQYLERSQPYAMVLRAGLFLVFVLVWHFYGVDLAKTILGKGSLPFRDYLRARQFGRGGSAHFSGILEEWSHPIRKNALIAGRGSYDPSRVIAFQDDRAAIVLGGARGGKGRCLIVPNLLHWGGSAIVIDPRGANAAITASRRGDGLKNPKKCMHQDVYCLNPFGVNSHVPWMPKGNSFNPLANLDTKDINYESRLKSIANALILDEQSGQNIHFTGGTRGFILGLLDYFVKTAPSTANLGDIRDALTLHHGPIRPDPNDRTKPYLLKKMVAAGGLAQEGASHMILAGEKEFGGFMTTALIQTDWLSRGGPIRRSLEKSDFAISDLKFKPSTLYVVLPTHAMASTPQFLRLFFAMIVDEASMGRRANVPILLLMDEFKALGPLKSLLLGASDLAGFKVKLFPVLQNLGQLKELYPTSWETFFNSTGQAFMFAANDNETAKYIADKVGTRTFQRVRVQLRGEEEVPKETSRRSGRLLVTREGEAPMILKRVRYDEDPLFRDLWQKDPDHTKFRNQKP